MFLMIRNPRLANHNILTLIGASTSRGTDAIGMYGSGFKHTIALFIREAIKLIYFSGNLKMEFFGKPVTVDGKTFNRICVRYSGKLADGTTKNCIEELGFVSEWGEADWTDATMGVRELVANAIDGAVANGGSAKDVELEIVASPRARAGYTAAFVEYTPTIQRIFSKLHFRFLHFEHQNLLTAKVMPKMCDDGFVRIYKKGVLVREIEGQKSCFDYNLGDELTMDESRNASEWDVENACSIAMAAADASQIAVVLNRMILGDDVWEKEFNGGKLKSEYAEGEELEVRAVQWRKAWQMVGGERGVAIMGGSPYIHQFVEQKGFTPLTIACPAWLRALTRYGCPTEATILSKGELEGKVMLPPTAEHVAALEWAWQLASSFQLTNDIEKPKLVAFKTIMNAGAQTRGVYDSLTNTIWLHVDLEKGLLLNKVCLHELGHACSKSGDSSPDFVDWAYRLAAEIAS